MRTTITKTVSMMLVTVMVLGVVAMPMRANAAFEVSQTFGANPYTLTLDIINLVIKMGIEMTSGVNQGHPLPETISSIAAFWEPYVTSSVILLTQQQMSELVQDLKTKGVTCELYRNNLFPAEYMCIRIVSLNIAGVDFTGEISFGSYYTYDGRTVVCKVDSSSASQNPTNKFTEDDGGEQETVLVIDPETQKLIEVTVTNAVQNAMKEYLATINVTNNTAYNPTTNTYNNYTDMSYNPITKTYQVNFADNRSYEYNFYYDYTYITYIGSSAEYREAYKVYYELPDGRSSGDLTVDELKGISLQFDMVNYDTAASDTLTQALFPFDGDVENIAYYPNEFQWVANASTSYLESPDGFGGNLYLDLSSPTRFNIRNTSTENEGLGFRVVESGFTIQMRLYAQAGYSAFAFCFDGLGQVAWDSKYDSSFLEWHHQWNFWNLCSFYDGNLVFRDFIGSTVQGDASRPVYVPHPIGEWFDFTVVYVPPLNGFKEIPQNDYLSSPGRYYIYLNGLLVYTHVCKPSSQYNFSLYRYLESYTSMSWAGSTLQTNHAPNLSFLGGFALFCPQGTGADIQLDNFRIVRTALYNGADSFTPTPVPFDTNLVYVLPSVADLNDNAVAIMSQLPVSGYRVGGIRPTDPTLASGYIYMHIDGDFVDSVQQWNGAYWEEVTARLYTGVRWIPVTAFNVFTLEDMFDIIDPDGDGSGESVSSIYQYYLWWSGEWGTFQEWLKGTMQTLIEAIQASGGGGGSTDAPVVIVPGVNDQTTTSEITTENPDGSTTKTTIVSNAAGLVYSNSVTTYPTDANGNTKTITVYTDSSGVMYQTETIIDKDGNVTVTEPTKATGTLGSILKMITGGVMKIAGTVIEGFVTIVVDGVKFIIDSADGLFTGIGDLFTTLFGAVTDFTDSVQDFVNPPGSVPAVDDDDDEQGDGDGGQTINIFDAFFQVLPDWLVSGFTLCFVMMIVFSLLNKIHF